jgi:hypothetical protein
MALLCTSCVGLAGCGSGEDSQTIETKPEDDPTLNSEEMESMTAENQ